MEQTAATISEDEENISFVDKANRYIRGVLTNTIDVCELVKLACKRQVTDLKRAETDEFPYYFSPEAAERICTFAELMVHVKGKWAGQHLHLEDWQCFCLCVPFGWLSKEDNTRRFTEEYLKIPRKNGKSIVFGSIQGLYLAFLDGEAGAEVYSGATTEKQALEVFKPAWLMVSRNEQFREMLHLQLSGTPVNPKSVYRIADGSKFEVIIGEPGDGSSPNGAIVDEYHQHRNSVLYDTMRTGMGARTQPMQVVVTTAGIDTSSPCYEHEERMKKILLGTITNERVFVCMYGIDKDDDWKDFSVWKKANPNYGVSVMKNYLEQQYLEAKQNVAKQNILLTKHLNLWMNAGSAWMNMLKWQACAYEYATKKPLNIKDFYGCDAYVAFDLASRIDMAALIVVTRKDENSPWVMFSRAYLPSETVALPQNAHYRQWRAEGYLTVTEGARTDFNAIEADLKAYSDIFNIQEVAYDPKEATMLVSQIELWANFPCVEVTQSVTQISEPMQETEALIYEQKLLHDNNPVFNWMMGNVVKKKALGGGPTKYYYPTKNKDTAKIDGPVALMMCMKRALANDEGTITQGMIDVNDKVDKPESNDYISRGFIA